nr:unnamed protein product [Callosobruchus chinensis]
MFTTGEKVDWSKCNMTSNDPYEKEQARLMPLWEELQSDDEADKAEIIESDDSEIDGCEQLQHNSETEQEDSDTKGVLMQNYIGIEKDTFLLMYRPLLQPIKRRLHNNEFGDSILIADSGYANTLHVITPLLQPTNDIQNVFNEAVTRTRNPVKRQYGVWKRRFPVLGVGIRVQLATTLNIIVATAVLHNITIDHNEDGPIDDPEISSVNFNEEIVVGAPVGPNHTNARDFLLTEYIPHLLH